MQKRRDADGMERTIPCPHKVKEPVTVWSVSVIGHSVVSQCDWSQCGQSVCLVTVWSVSVIGHSVVSQCDWSQCGQSV